MPTLQNKCQSILRQNVYVYMIHVSRVNNPWSQHSFCGHRTNSQQQFPWVGLWGSIVGAIDENWENDSFSVGWRACDSFFCSICNPRYLLQYSAGTHLKILLLFLLNLFRIHFVSRQWQWYSLLLPSLLHKEMASLYSSDEMMQNCCFPSQLSEEYTQLYLP